MAREMDPVDLVEALHALEETVRAELPAQVAARATRLLEEGLAVAKCPPSGDAGVSACAVEMPGADTARARAMGFPQDADFASILRDYMRQYAPAAFR